MSDKENLCNQPTQTGEAVSAHAASAGEPTSASGGDRSGQDFRWNAAEDSARRKEARRKRYEAMEPEDYPFSPALEAEKPESASFLIERRDLRPPHWLTVKDEMFDWTTDPNEAIRLARREDADKLAELVIEEDIAITEHKWVTL